MTRCSVTTQRSNLSRSEGPSAKALLLQAEFNAMRQRLHMPPALPQEQMMFDEED